ncbi:MAG: flagellar FlbD family protein [Planctomycetes bacterium]|nr:flagellar FlbD family protein [Planctomycetota bacterium]
MITLTKTSGESIVVNSDLILFVEQTPDTLITFRDGQHLIVREKADEVVRKAMDYTRLARTPWSSEGTA